MATMNLTLPDELMDFVNAQAESRGLISPADYLNQLIRLERDRVTFSASIQQGIASGVAGEMDADFFESLEQHIRDTAAGRE
jgi:antitoxin ParD1/3/4